MKRKPPRPYHYVTWTPERDATLLAMLGEGATAAAAGAALGVSRSAVIGRHHRLRRHAFASDQIRTMRRNLIRYAGAQP